jgi:MazG family protein
MDTPADSSPGAEFERLVALMRTLRSPEGCPWDRDQTLESLAPFVLEETYEVLDAIERGDLDALEGEIGDLVFEAVFLAQICAESGRFTIADSLRAIVGKLIRRHPHVFQPDGTRRIDTAAAVVEQWEKLKEQERHESGAAPSVLGGVARTLPALLAAYEIGSRVAAVGFDWPDAREVLRKVDEELAELRAAVAHEPHGRIEEELGDLLFAVANLARKLGFEPEAALRKANRKFDARFRRVEERLRSRGSSVHEASLDEMEAAWTEIKQAETGP